MRVRVFRQAPLLALLVCLGLAVCAAAAAAVPISLGHSTVSLNGPWSFALGDDPRRADPAFDDSAWEHVDLTPAPGAHDGDVGLVRYVSGWNARGHRGSSGYGWYRLKVAVTGPPGARLALAGPTAVDNVYQLYGDGRLLGGSGVFAGAAPVAYGVQPRGFALGALPASGVRTVSLALRVWMGPGGAKIPDAGGIRVAPVLGDRESIDAVVQGQWLQTFEGYVVDAVEPILLLLLALMLVPLIVARPREPAPLWLAAALVLLALVRLQQIVLFWTQWESQYTYDVLRNVILAPLALGAWTLAWRSWFGAGRSRAFPVAAATLTALYVVAQLLSRTWWPPVQAMGLAAAAHTAAGWIRLALLALYLWTLGRGVARMRTPAGAVAVLAAVLTGIGLFAEELSNLHVKGIWFPWGVGVSRTQYAYAGAIGVLFALILVEVWRLARLTRDPAPASTDTALRASSVRPRSA